MNGNIHTIYVGVLDSESFWDDNAYAELPALPDRQIDDIVLAMDEIQYILCKKEDVVLTGCAMDPAFLEYLKGIGIEFICNRKDIYTNLNPRENIFQSGICQPEIERLRLQGKYQLSPYAVIPCADDFAKAYDIYFASPDMRIIRLVNSKTYSTELRDQLNIRNYGCTVYSPAQLEKSGREMLNRYGRFMIKHPFGVSGKGSIVVDSPKVLTSLLRYITKQHDKKTEFVLEQFLENKEKDISTQLVLSDTVNIVATQEVLNSGLSYMGTKSAASSVMRRLEQSGYFDVLVNMGKDMIRQGYCGDVCVDSMLLKSGEVIPIVEINARKSMSLINFHASNYFKKYGLNCLLSCFQARYSRTMTTEAFLELLRRHDLLFSPENDKGILPLSMNSLFINRGSSYSVKKGRLYYAAAYQNWEEYEAIVENTKRVLTESGFILS